MHPIESFVRNPVKVAVGVLLVTLFGVIGYLRMPMQLTPEVQIPTIEIQTRWPGASPQEVEDAIIREQEEQLQSVEGLVKMSSESSDSRGSVTLEFLVGTNMEEALVKVNSRLAQVPEYPENADEPVVTTSSSADRPIAWFILSQRLPKRADIEAFLKKYPQYAELLQPVVQMTDVNAGLAALRLKKTGEKDPELQQRIYDEGLLPPPEDVTKLRTFAEDYIEARLERVEGVSNANVFGGRELEVQVILDPHRLAARQLTVADVRRALQGQNKDTSGGDFWEGKRRYVVRTLGQFRSLEQIEDQLVAVRDGQPVYVRDIIEPNGVVLGHKKPDGVVRRFGSGSIAVNAQRTTGANVLDVMEGLREAVRELNAGLLAQRRLELTQVYDETEYINAAIGLVNTNIIVGGLLTVGVLLLFLKSARSTIVIALAIPTSIVGTFLMLNLMGRSLNVISLAGLAFAVGMLVDNAVVVLENIYRHYQMGDSPLQAAVRGTKEVWGAVIASTLTTLAVFLPVLFVQEEAGQLFRDIALAISSAVGLSLLVSATVVPTASSRLFRQSGHRQSAVHRFRALQAVDRFGGWFVDLVVAVNAGVQRTLVRRLTVVLGLVALSVGLAWLLWPKVEYLPTGNRNLVFGIVLPPPGYNLNELMTLGERVEKQLQPYWDVDPNSPEAAELDYPVIGDWFYVARGRQVFMGLRAADSTRAWELVPLLQSVREILPGSIVVANQSSLFEQGLGAGRSIDVEITGPELEKLVSLGGKILGQVRTPEVLGPEAQARPIPSLDLSSPEVHVLPKLQKSTEMQISTADLGYTVDALIDGAYATDYFRGSDKIDLSLMGGEAYAQHTQDLETIPIATPTGELVPLAAIADIQLDSGPEQVNRRERQRAITIQVTPPAEMPLAQAIELIQTKIVQPIERDGQLEDANGQRYLIRMSGTADKLRDTWLALRWNVLLALLITYLLMAALFESWVHPFVIILSVPLAAVGGVLGLRLLNVYQVLVAQVQGMPTPPPQTLDVLTMLGFVILIGTAVNNAILIVHQSLNHMRDEDMLPKEAILESVRTRIRPIFMTTTTTVIGLAPLVLFPGAGSELYRGLGSVMLGGLLVSTVFTLFLVPTLFGLMIDLMQLWSGSVAAAVSAPTIPSEARHPEIEEIELGNGEPRQAGDEEEEEVDGAQPSRWPK